MTEPTWKTHTPQYDGHAPDDWEKGCETEYLSGNMAWVETVPSWYREFKYRYRPLQDATHEPDLLAQCLRLPQAARDALIEALQKPQRDWADDVWREANVAWDNSPTGAEGDKDAAAVIRSMCRPKEEN